MPIFAAVLGHVLTNKRLTAALLASLAQFKGGYQSGQMGQTVNLLAFAFGGSNPSPPTSVEVFAEIAQLIEH